MRTSHKVLVAAAAFVLALGGALLFMNSSPSSGSGSGSKGSGDDDRGGSDTAAVTSRIWTSGDSWTVEVRQDAGAITPDGDSSVATVPFRFRVTEAPEQADGLWHVRVTQDGAEGPFAKGWHLYYQPDAKGVMVLKFVATGDEPKLEAELASIALGPQFPYEVRYAAPPKDYAVDAAKLLKRSELPPSSLPGGGGDGGAAPPAEAPGGAPDPSAAPQG